MDVDLDAVTLAPQPRKPFVARLAAGAERRVCDWAQTTADATVFVDLEPGTKARALTVAIGKQTLDVRSRSSTIIAGTLPQEVNTSESEWVLENGELVITLHKARHREWLAPFEVVTDFRSCIITSACEAAGTRMELGAQTPEIHEVDQRTSTQAATATRDVASKGHEARHSRPSQVAHGARDPLGSKYDAWSKFDEDEAVMTLENEGKSTDESTGWTMRATPGVAAVQATDYVKDKEEVALDRELAEKHKELQSCFNGRLSDAAQLKQMGNEQLGKGQASAALSSYLEGADLLETITNNATPLLSARLAATANELRRDLLNNGAQAALKSDEWEVAIAAATEALKLVGKAESQSSTTAQVKALYRRASAYVARGEVADVDKAKADLHAVLRLQPQNKTAKTLLETELLR